MVNVLLITADTTALAYTRSKAALEAAGHVVTGSLDTTTALDAAWSAGSFDLIATVRATYGATAPAVWMSWARDKWAAGTPLLIGGTEAGSSNFHTTHLAEYLGLLSDARTYANTGSVAGYCRSMRVRASHEITAGYSVGAEVGLFSTNTSNFVVLDYAVTPAWGVELGDAYAGSTDYGVQMLAVEAADPLNATAALAPAGGTAPARAVFCGWFYAGQDDYSTAARSLLANSVAWATGTPGAVSGTLTGTAPSVTGSFNATVTTPPVVVDLAGTAPAVTGSFAVEQVGVGVVDLAGTAPGVFGSFDASVSVGAVEVATDAVNRLNGMTLVTEWQVEVEPPVTEPKRQRAHDYAIAVSLTEPTLEDGRPT